MKCFLLSNVDKLEKKNGKMEQEAKVSQYIK